MEISPEVIAALIGAGSLIIITLIQQLVRFRNQAKQHRSEADQSKLEMEFQHAALSFDTFLAEWDTINRDILQLFEETNISRFLLLRAWNGVTDPKWTTAIFQVRQYDNKPVSYVHFELDDDYRDRLRTIEHTGRPLVFTVEEIQDSFIKDVYRAEGVKHSAWFPVEKKRLGDSENYAITYCSFASNDDQPISDDELTKARLIVNQLKHVSSMQ